MWSDQQMSSIRKYLTILSVFVLWTGKWVNKNAILVYTKSKIRILTATQGRNRVFAYSSKEKKKKENT